MVVIGIGRTRHGCFDRDQHIGSTSLTGKAWKIKIIAGDAQGSSAYYPKEALQEGAHLFAPKTKIYLNHPSADDKFNQPERRVQDIVGYLSEGATFDGKDLYANATFLPEFQDDIKALAEAGLIGMSIRAEGEISEAAGKKTLTRFTRVNSVDVVTSPGAGGGFDKLLESAKCSAPESGAESTKEKESVMEKEIVEALATLKTDLTAAIAEAIAAAMDEAMKPSVCKDDKAKADAEDAKDGGKDEGDENPDGTKKKKPAVKESASYVEIDAALVEAKLPSASRATVFALVEAGADLKESVDAEAAKVQSILTEAGASFRGFASDDAGVKTLEEATPGMLGKIYGSKAVTGK